MGSTPPIPPSASSSPPPPPVSVPETPLRPDGWLNNWKYLVPLGCLTGVALFFVIGLCVGGIAVMALMWSDGSTAALATAMADPRVQHVLGSNIHRGFFASGKTSLTGPSGDVDLAISISGSKSKATIYVTGTKSAGEWHYTKFIIKTEEGETVDLLNKSNGNDITDEDHNKN
jgi:hypothetical protein